MELNNYTTGVGGRHVPITENNNKLTDKDEKRDSLMSHHTAILGL